jgi:hypothetical protein
MPVFLQLVYNSHDLLKMMPLRLHPCMQVFNFFITLSVSTLGKLINFLTAVEIEPTWPHSSVDRALDWQAWFDSQCGYSDFSARCKDTKRQQNLLDFHAHINENKGSLRAEKRKFNSRCTIKWEYKLHIRGRYMRFDARESMGQKIRNCYTFISTSDHCGRFIGIWKWMNRRQFSSVFGILNWQRMVIYYYVYKVMN